MAQSWPPDLTWVEGNPFDLPILSFRSLTLFAYRSPTPTTSPLVLLVTHTWPNTARRSVSAYLLSRNPSPGGDPYSSAFSLPRLLHQDTPQTLRTSHIPFIWWRVFWCEALGIRSIWPVLSIQHTCFGRARRILNSCDEHGAAILAAQQHLHLQLRRISHSTCLANATLCSLLSSRPCVHLRRRQWGTVQWSHGNGRHGRTGHSTHCGRCCITWHIGHVELIHVFWR